MGAKRAGLIGQTFHDLGDRHDRCVGTQDRRRRRCRFNFSKDRLLQRHLFRRSFKDKCSILNGGGDTIDDRDAGQDLRDVFLCHAHQLQTVSDTRRQTGPRFGHRVGHAHRMACTRQGQGNAMPHQPRPDHRDAHVCHLIPPYSRHRRKECGPCRNLMRERLGITRAPPDPLARPSAPLVRAPKSHRARPWRYPYRQTSKR